MKYKIIYSDAFVASLKKLQGKLATKIVGKLELLANDPYTPNNNVKRMKGEVGVYRLRVGDLRVVYKLIDDKLILIAVKVGFRGSIYED